MTLIIAFIVGTVCFGIGFILAALLALRDHDEPLTQPAIRVEEGDNIRLIRPRMLRKQAS